MADYTTPRTYDKDPLRSYKFKVEIVGEAGLQVGTIGFQSVSGLGHSIDVIEYREGGDPEFLKKIPGLSSFDNLTLERGKYIGTQGSDLLRWLKRVYNPLLDTTDSGVGAHDNNFRATITITLFSTYNNVPACQWTCYQAWPVNYSVGDLQTSSSELLIDSVEIAYEYMTQQYFNAAGVALNE